MSSDPSTSGHQQSRHDERALDSLTWKIRDFESKAFIRGKEFGRTQVAHAVRDSGLSNETKLAFISIIEEIELREE